MTKKTIDALAFGAVWLFMAISPTLSAQQQSEQKPLHFDFTPFIGYRTSMSLPVEPHVSGTNPRVVLDSSPSFGASFGVRLQEDGLVEFRWARQDSYFHSENVSPPFSHQHAILDQFHGDFSHEYTLDELRPWMKPFIMLSVGATHISSGNQFSFTRFSFGIGGGMRFYPTRHVGFKIQAEYVPVLIDPQATVICGGGCIVHIGSTLGSQGEVFIGPLFRF